MPRACELTPGRGLARSYTNRLPSGPADEGRWYLFPVAAAGYRLVFLLLMPKPLFRQGSESCLDVGGGRRACPVLGTQEQRGSCFLTLKVGAAPEGQLLESRSLPLGERAAGPQENKEGGQTVLCGQAWARAPRTAMLREDTASATTGRRPGPAGCHP